MKIKVLRCYNTNNVELTDIIELTDTDVKERYKIFSKFIPVSALTETGINKIIHECPNYPLHFSDPDYLDYLLKVYSDDELMCIDEQQWKNTHTIGTWNDTPITEEILKQYGFELYIDPIIKKLSDKEKAELESEGINTAFIEYTRTVTNVNNKPGQVWYVTMKYDMSNTKDRDWGCHIDNCVHESVAYVDIGTIGQFNKIMDLMDIEYRL